MKEERTDKFCSLHMQKNVCKGAKMSVLLPAAMAQIKYEVIISMDSILWAHARTHTHRHTKLSSTRSEFLLFLKVYSFHWSHQQIQLNGTANCTNLFKSKAHEMPELRAMHVAHQLSDEEGEWKRNKRTCFGWVFCVLLFCIACNRVTHVFWVASQANSDSWRCLWIDADDRCWWSHWSRPVNRTAHNNGIDRCFFHSVRASKSTKRHSTSAEIKNKTKQRIKAPQQHKY